jgi:hypothetical protein
MQLKGDMKYLNSTIERLNAMRDLDGNRYNSFAFSSRQPIGAADCTLSLLYGLDRMLKKYAHLLEGVPLSDIYKRIAPTPDEFSDTGAPGILINPIIFDESGDLATNWNIYGISSNTSNCILSMDSCNGTTYEPKIFSVLTYVYCLISLLKI